MFGSYATLAHRHVQGDVNFYDSRADEEAFLKSKPPLSDEIISTYKPPNPWQSSPTFEGDFVLVCEFSELEGPKPVMTVPKDSGGDFEQNDFALKIMAIDYNATNVVRSGGSFTLVEDTGVVLEEPKESAFAYVHHFTLYDIIARGYVRPFCIAYISSDKRKIIRNLAWLSKKFSKVSESFRYGNHCLFKRDLERRKADIHFTIGNVSLQHPPQHHDDEITSERGSPLCQDARAKQKLHQQVETLEKGLDEVDDILRTVAPELVNPKLEARFRRLEELATTQRLAKSRAHRYPTSVHEEGYHSDGDDKLVVQSNQRRMKRISTCDSIVDLTSSLETDTQHVPQMIRVDGFRKFDIRLRTLHELCGWGYKAGLNSVRKIHHHLSRNYVVLHMERRESRLVEPASSLLTIGRSITTNFVHLVDMQCVNGSFHDEYNAGRHCWTTLKQNMNTSPAASSPSFEERVLSKLHSSSFEAKFVPGTAYASMESLYYDVNESPDESSEDEEVTSIPKKLTGNGLMIASDDGSWLDLDFASRESEYSSSTDMSASPAHRHKYYNRVVHTPSDEVDDAASAGEVAAHDATADSNSPSTSSCGGDLSQVPDSVNPPPCSDSYIVRRHQKVSVGSYASRINSFNTCLPGSGVRNIIGQYTFAIHLVYALLSGRPVVVLSHPRFEKEVTSLIRTLWLFVPGHSSKYHLVVPWHTRPLHQADLKQMKLVGLAKHKSAMPVIPTSVQKHITIYEYDNSTLSTPPYNGSYLNLLIKSFKSFRSDQAYIAFIHCIFSELAAKAFVYHHSFMLNSPPFQPLPENDGTISEMLAKSNVYLSKLGVAEGDADIIRYWVEIIKQQQIDEMYVQTGSTVTPTPSEQLDYRQCKEYQI
ncbi:guanine nucleotide exchange protein smcr8a-like isoform X2 [Asterias amurensis]|uniref:guanine nucleotide exchange protein smcr8a-like isoform X2 n=1 Tax=Asterias amurensis TaxID=7602 RepID=UPI003AB13DB1